VSRRAVLDAEDEHVRPHLPDVAEDHVPRAQAIYVGALIHELTEMEQTIDDEHLVVLNVQVIDGNRLPLCRRDAVEPERDADFARRRPVS